MWSKVLLCKVLHTRVLKLKSFPAVIFSILTVSLLTAACFTSAGNSEELDHPLAKDELIGIWTNDQGESIEFDEESASLQVLETFTGKAGDSLVELSSEWILCDSPYFEREVNEYGAYEEFCTAGTSGYWIELDAVNGFRLDPLILTEQYGEIELYRYNVDDRGDGDDERFRKQ